MIRSECTALALVSLFVFSCNTKQAQPAAADKTSVEQQAPAPPKVVTIASLPDSLQPKIVSLDKMPKPLTVVVPGKEGGFYNRKYANGDIVKIMLKPPVKKMLAVLTDEKGRPVKDAAGNPIIMGRGGKSSFTNLTSDDGLALNAITCSILDKAGNLWFGTQGAGASRYDGKSFTNFSTTNGLTDNTIACIFQDRAGNIWFGTNVGANKYDGKSFTSFTSARGGLADGAVRDIFEDKDGKLWLVTQLGVSKYDGKTFTAFSTKDGPSNNNISRIIQDRKGNMWFSTSSGVSKYDGRSFTNYTTANGLTGNLVSCMIEATDGTFWFGTNTGVSKYDGKTFTNFGIAQGLPNEVVQAISEDKTGNLWFGTSGGISKYDGKSFTNFTTGQGLADNNTRSITEDKAGNLWFGTFEAGVIKYAGNSFTSFTTSDGLPNNLIWNVRQDKAGNYWFCTTNGLSKYDGKSFTNFSISQGLANNNIQSMTEDRAGNLWFGTAGSSLGGISRYDGKSFTTFTTEQGMAGNSITIIIEDRDDNLWFGSAAGLNKFDGKSFTTYTTAQGLVNNSVNGLYNDKEGNLWVSTNDGISRFDGKTFTNFKTAQGLSNDVINCVKEDKYGNIWIGTEGGVSRLSANEQDKLNASSNGTQGVKFDNFTTAQGLADDQAYDLIQDKKGDMFIGTNLGFTVIPAEMSSLPFSQIRKSIEYYNRPSGYPVRDINSGAMYCDNQGIIWSGTGGALVRFDYSSLHKEAGPVLAIQKIKVNGQNVCWFDLQSGGKLENAEDSAKSMFQESMAYGKMITPADRDSVIKRFGGIELDSISSFYLLPQNLRLPYDKNQVTIDFNALETSKPQQVEYQYMLQGYEKEWSPVTKATSATFGNMYEGSYTFMVKARKSNGDWSEPITYNFKVLPPWYRTWWAYLFYALCLIAGLILIDRIRRKVVEERLLAKTREKELAQAREIEKAYTELKTTQAQLVQSEKMASLGELTAGIAHEIQNPLNFVNNFSEVSNELIGEMVEEVDKGNTTEVKTIAENIKQNLEKIIHHGKRADAIVKGMLQHSRSSTGVKELVSINAIADECLRLSYHGLRARDKSFNATLKTNFDESIDKIPLVQQDIVRVLINLFNNAFYAVNEKIKTNSENYQPIVSVQTKKLNDKILLTVMDNGNGIPQKVIDKIFQPFFTTKPAGQGTGLGLSMSYDIIKAHGGEIKVNTKEGEGTEFIIELPITA